MNKVFAPKILKIFKEGYSFNLFQNDLFAGIIVGIVALPLAIAFAVASGVSPEKGIVTAIVAGFIITIATILITVYSSKVIKKIPGSFFAIILMTLVVTVFKLQVNTIETVFGTIPNKIQLSTPAFQIDNLQKYIAPAFTIAVLGAIESLLSAVVADGMLSSNHRSNTELIAQGIANIVTPFFGGIPATGAIARTATNIKNGGRTPVAGIIHAITLLLIMFFLGKWAVLIPLPCLAGILIVVSYNMSEWKSFVSIFKGSKYDILVLLTTFALTVLVDLTIAIQIGMVLAAMLFMKRMGTLSNITPIEQDDELFENYSDLPKEISVYEINGPFFFAAARKYKETLKNLHLTNKIIILRMRHVPFIDSTGIHNFKSTLLELKSNNATVILSGVQEEVKKELINHHLINIIGEENIFKNFNHATQKAVKILQENNNDPINTEHKTLKTIQ